MATTATPRVSATRIIAFLLLGLACTLSSIALLISLCVAMPVVTDQFTDLLKSAQWNVAPLSMILTRTGFAPHFDGYLTPINWLLSCETGLLIVVAGAAFGYAVHAFETAHKTWASVDTARRQVKKSQPTTANIGTSTSTARAVKAKKLGMAMPRSTAMA
jgi:hypothetical protein